MVNSQLPLCDPVKETNPSIPEREGTEEYRKYTEGAMGQLERGLKESIAPHRKTQDMMRSTVSPWGSDLEQPPTSPDL